MAGALPSATYPKLSLAFFMLGTARQLVGEREKAVYGKNEAVRLLPSAAMNCDRGVT